MKKLTGLVVILAVLILGGYYVMGVVTEKTVKNNLAVINQSNGLFADIAEYHRGWFKSTAVLNWRLHVPERVVKSPSGESLTEPAQDFQMQMPLVIYHGPFIFHHGLKFGFGYAQTDLALPVKYADQFNEMFTTNSTKPKMDLSLLVTYLNSSKVNMSIPEFKLIAKEGHSEFDWLGMKSSMDVSSSKNNVSGVFVIDGLRFKKDDVTATTSKLTSDYALHQTDAGLFLGDATLKFPSLLVKNKDEKILEMSDFQASTSSDVANGLFHSEFKSSLNKIVTDGKTYGPAKLDMALRNLDAVVLARINEQANKAQQGSDVEKQQALFAILPELPKLFSRGAEFAISELSLVMPEGTLEGNLMITLPKGDIVNPIEIMQKVQGNAKIKIPEGVLKQAVGITVRQKLLMAAAQPATTATTNTAVPAAESATASTPAQPVLSEQDLIQKAAAQTDQQVNNMVESGLLVKQGADYVIELKLEQGQLAVNGKPFNPAMIKF